MDGIEQDKSLEKILKHFTDEDVKSFMRVINVMKQELIAEPAKEMDNKNLLVRHLAALTATFAGIFLLGSMRLVTSNDKERIRAHTKALQDCKNECERIVRERMAIDGD